jgi:hypothetical protein
MPVRRQLRQEVGFGCPVENCRSPYLTYHHFDPPWKEKKHHDPAGMVALCRPHHAQADAGTFTREQLRRLKATGRDQAENLSGRFEWMRRELLAVVGGWFCYDVRIIVQAGDRPSSALTVMSPVTYC